MSRNALTHGLNTKFILGNALRHRTLNELFVAHGDRTPLGVVFVSDVIARSVSPLRRELYHFCFGRVKPIWKIFFLPVSHRL